MDRSQKQAWQWWVDLISDEIMENTQKSYDDIKLKTPFFSAVIRALGWEQFANRP